ncbi:MAG: EAL domain-containing protein [Pseudomonadota bacterium]|nr:EAL domain-containing protein [Pseudomonadota bacterium]
MHLALSLELTIVAEGIETQSHFAALKALGCHLGQGYFMCRPMGMADFFTKFIDDCQVA